METATDVPTWEQLDRYAEDFGALFAAYQTIQRHYEKASQDNLFAHQIQQRIDALLDGMENVGVMTTTADGFVSHVSRSGLRLFTHSKAEMYGQPLANFLAVRDRSLIGDVVQTLGSYSGDEASPFGGIRIVTAEGLPLSARVVRIPDPESGYRLLWLMHAKTSRSPAASSELIAQLYAQSSNAIVVTDLAGRIQSTNPAFTRITGYAQDEVVGHSPSVLSSGKHPPAFFEQMWDRLHDKGEWQGEIWNRRKSGELYLSWLQILAIRDQHGGATQYVGMFHDEGYFRNAQNRIYELANHDALTGLPNRTLLCDRLEQCIMQARRNQGHVGLLFVDLDRFKTVNDTLGHAVGDQLLIEFSWRLVHVIRDSDTAARLGGDEFVVVAPGLSREEDIDLLADKIIRSLAQPFLIEGHELYVGASVGVAVYPTHGSSADELLKHADVAMYVAKSEGGNICRLFNDDLGREKLERHELEGALRRALSEGQLELNYQPQVSSSDGRLVGVEALLRWNRGEPGYVAPERFIPIAEDTGLILPIGEWVLRTACQQLGKWHQEGHPYIRMAVNVTARQLNAPDFPDLVREILQEAGVPAEYLELEITESQLMEKLHIGIANLSLLRGMGIAIAVDDFGTGYSSLGRIKMLPIDRIKVDKSFIEGLAKDANSYAIAHAVVAMAQAMHIETIAEGVEETEQAVLLNGIRCNELQGYLFGKPQPAEGISQLLAQRAEE